MFFIILDFKIIEFFRSNSNTTKNAELSSRSANTKKKTTKKPPKKQQHLRHCENEARKKMKLASLPLDIPYSIPTIDGVPRLLISFG